jgi:hypothetical protein
MKLIETIFNTAQRFKLSEFCRYIEFHGVNVYKDVAAGCETDLLRYDASVPPPAQAHLLTRLP